MRRNRKQLWLISAKNKFIGGYWGSSEDGWKRSLDVRDQRVQPVTTHTELMGDSFRVAVGMCR